MGNTRVVLDDNGDVKEFYDYYPFGLTQRENITGADQARYKFTGKELDEEGDLGWYYFGARYYDPRIGRFLSVDPLADDYPAWSPYNYSLNNPLRFIDPTGMSPDDYGLDEDGNINLLRKTDDETDKIIALDNKGEETDKSIEVEKGILNNPKKGKTSGDASFDYYEVNNNEQASKLFEFAAQNTNVEWSQIKYGTKSNYISTTHLEHQEPGGVQLLYNLIVGKYTVREHIHSHPFSTSGPTGYRLNQKNQGDKDLARWIFQYAPNIKLKIYEKRTKKYIHYDFFKVYKE